MSYMEIQPWSASVARVDCIAVPGVELFFNSLDHLPPHFHALRPGEWEVRVYFLKERAQMLDLKWRQQGMTGATRRALTKLAEEHREDLLQEFDEKVNTDD